MKYSRIGAKNNSHLCNNLYVPNYSSEHCKLIQKLMTIYDEMILNHFSRNKMKIFQLIWKKDISMWFNMFKLNAEVFTITIIFLFQCPISHRNIIRKVISRIATYWDISNYMKNFIYIFMKIYFNSSKIIIEWKPISSPWKTWIPKKNMGLATIFYYTKK